MKPVILEAIGLNKFYRDTVEFQALKDVNLQINKGEFVSIVGASGSGKSTLLYVLSTLDSNYEGKIILDGEDVSTLSANRQSELRNKKIGFVFQFHYLLPEFTVLENVALPAMKLGQWSQEEIEHRVLEKLRLLGVEDQAYKKANKLSGGQQQRVAIARALINDPAIIFGDEPTGNLDSKNTQVVFDLFKVLRDELKQTICIVTHDMSLSAQTDRIITLHDGSVVNS